MLDVDHAINNNYFFQVKFYGYSKENKMLSLLYTVGVDREINKVC